MTYVIPVLAGIAVFLFVFGLARELMRSEGIDARLEQYGSQKAKAAGDDVKGPKEMSQLSANLERAIAKQTFGQKLQRDLNRADIKLTVGEFMAIIGGAGVLGFLAGFVVFRNPIIAVAVGFVGTLVPRMYVNNQRKKRLNQFNNQLSDTIGLLSNSLRSGYSMFQSMEMVAREGAPPISQEFERVVREVGLGLAPDEALEHLVDRMQSDDLEMMVTAMNVQREVGGNLAEILDTISHTIRERVKLKGEVKVLTAQQAISGYVITGLPVVLSLVLFLINPKYMSTLWTDQCGWVMVGVSVSMISIGYFFIRKITKIEI